MTDIATATDGRRAVAELLSTCARLVDAGDWEGVADLFRDATLTAEAAGIAIEGRDAILDMQRSKIRLYDDGTPKTHHTTTDVIIDVDEEGGTATADAAFTVFQAIPGVFPLQCILAGRYRDGFRLVDGTWRYASRHTTVTLRGDMSHHLVGGLSS